MAGAPAELFASGGKGRCLFLLEGFLGFGFGVLAEGFRGRRGGVTEQPMPQALEPWRLRNSGGQETRRLE